MKTIFTNQFEESVPEPGDPPSPVTPPKSKPSLTADDRNRLDRLFGGPVAIDARLTNFSALSEKDQEKALEAFPDLLTPRFTSPAKAERDQAQALALAKVKHEREAFDAKRAKELNARDKEDAHAAADAQARVEEARKALVAKIGPDFQSKITPVVNSFCDEPSRESSRQAIALWNTLVARCGDEVGAEPHPMQLAAPFYARHIEKYGARVFNAALDFKESYPAGMAAHAAVVAMRSSDPTLASRALQALECAITEAVMNASAAPSALNQAKFELGQRVATYPDLSAALAELQTEFDRLERERRMANFVPPPSIGDRRRATYGGLPGLR